jgi:hypothetical protein
MTDLYLTQHSLHVSGDCHCSLNSASGSLREFAALLRFVDIMFPLEPHAVGRLHYVSWGCDDVEIVIGGSGDSGEPLPAAYVERVGKRMAKVLWNLGGPSTVRMTDEFETYRFEWAKVEEMA